jgi:hypothetical protein
MGAMDYPRKLNVPGEDLPKVTITSAKLIRGSRNAR